MTVTVTLKDPTLKLPTRTRTFSVYNIHNIVEDREFIYLKGFTHTETPTHVRKSDMAMDLSVGA